MKEAIEHSIDPFENFDTLSLVQLESLLKDKKKELKNILAEKLKGYNENKFTIYREIAKDSEWLEDKIRNRNTPDSDFNEIEAHYNKFKTLKEEFLDPIKSVISDIEERIYDVKKYGQGSVEKLNKSQKKLQNERNDFYQDLWARLYIIEDKGYEYNNVKNQLRNLMDKVTTASSQEELSKYRAIVQEQGLFNDVHW